MEGLKKSVSYRLMDKVIHRGSTVTKDGLFRGLPYAHPPLPRLLMDNMDNSSPYFSNDSYVCINLREAAVRVEYSDSSSEVKSSS